MPEKTLLKEEAQVKRLDKTLRRNILGLCVLFVFFLLIQGITYLSELVLLFSGVLFACYLLLGPVNGLETFLKRWAPKNGNKIILGINFRLVSVVVVFVGFVLFLVVGAGQIFPVVTSQVSGFVKALPSYYSQVENQLDALSKLKLSTSLKIPSKEMNSSETAPTVSPSSTLGPNLNAQDKITRGSDTQVSESALGQMVLFFRNVATSAFSNVFDFLTTSLTGLVYGLTGLVLLFYFLLDGQALRKGFIALILPELSEPEWDEKVESFLDSTHFLFFTLLKVQVITSVLSGLMLYGVYSLLGVEFSGFLSFFFFICSLVPVIGPWVGALPSILVLLFSGEPVTMLVIFSLLGGFYILKQRWLLPRLLGDKLDIHPVLIILALLICTELVGPLGFLLAIPTACLIAVTYQFVTLDTPSLDSLAK